MLHIHFPFKTYEDNSFFTPQNHENTTFWLLPVYHARGIQMQSVCPQELSLDLSEEIPSLFLAKSISVDSSSAKCWISQNEVVTCVIWQILIIYLMQIKEREWNSKSLMGELTVNCHFEVKSPTKFRLEFLEL